jgi:acyl-coenzyme A synthetase/AMP-(fatty) acid ligase
MRTGDGAALSVPLVGACDDRPALIEAASGARLSYAELVARVQQRAAWLRGAGGDVAGGGAGGPSLIFRLCRNDLATVIDYLAALTAKVPIALFDHGVGLDALAELVRRYQPELVLGRASAAGGNTVGDGAEPDGTTGAAASAVAPSPELALLLSTSGSTGSPKLVQLSLGAVESNARAIAAALALGRRDVAPTSLPLHYSYGLSVLNSHLAAGATLVLTDESLLSAGFWAAAREHEITSLAGVPYSYQMLRRIDLGAQAPSSLRTLTQAGGRLDPGLVLHFHRLASARGGRLFVMYGQTEATARITVLSPADLPDHAGSVGQAIAGDLAIEDGEVVYRGPNVMLGYAESRADLALGDQLHGCLFTGDLGYLDGEGRLWITGRSKRIAKVFGLRLNLDEIEAWLRTVHGGPVAALADGDRLRVYLEGGDAASCAALREALSARVGAHASGFVVEALAALPVLPSGKLDYPQLEARKGAPR